jgi:hypothetical protein
LWNTFIYFIFRDYQRGLHLSLTHFFTPEEANRALPEITNLVSQAVELKKKIDRSPDSERSPNLDKLSSLMAKIGEKGAELKDADIGLIDFPAVRFNEPVYLCWKLGEEEVLYWHGSEGFRGRKPLKPEATKIV